MYLNRLGYILRGMQIGKNTFLQKALISWPHQVKIGDNCRIEPLVQFKFDGICKEGPSIFIGNRVFIGTGTEFNIRLGIEIGNGVLIGAGSRFIDHNHGTKLGKPMWQQTGEEERILIEEDVWIGANCIILKGVVLERGCIIGAGSLVNCSIPSNEIWAGTPAKKIKSR